MDTGDEPEALDRESMAQAAAAGLTRSLGRRGLSVAEARARLRADGLTDAEAADVVADFEQRGWLDDAALAEQLVYAATTRKDMGTRAVRQLLVKRLVSRDVIDAVVSRTARRRCANVPSSSPARRRARSPGTTKPPPRGA